MSILPQVANMTINMIIFMLFMIIFMSIFMIIWDRVWIQRKSVPKSNSESWYRERNTKAWMPCSRTAVLRLPIGKSSLLAHALSSRIRQWCQFQHTFTLQQPQMQSGQCNVKSVNSQARQWIVFQTGAIMVAGSMWHCEKKRYNGRITLHSALPENHANAENAR